MTNLIIKNFYDNLDLTIKYKMAGSGKSHLARKFTSDYKILSRDIFQKNFCKKLEDEIINNNNVVVEGLYIDNNSRKELKNLASKYKYNTTYILVKTSYELAYHLNLFRSLYQNKNRVPKIVYIKYKKNFEYPKESDWNEIIEYHPHISKKINKYFLY